jgi:processive 1,2-diacylglycerol beta-glucosyltransferase
MENQKIRNPKILILTVSHGASHDQLANALRKALIRTQPDVSVGIVNALEHCAGWFRLYYDSYQTILKFWPALWGWIENIQHSHQSTGPSWLYRRGAQPLFRFIQSSNPDIVISTEVGMCEIMAMLKRQTGASFHLVAAPTYWDIDRAWAQPAVDLYLITPGEEIECLQAAGVPLYKMHPSGTPIDEAFNAVEDRSQLRSRLGVDPNRPLLLILFGGTGFGKPARIIAELKKVQPPFQAVFIAGRNRRLEKELSHLCRDLPSARALGWVDNMAEWMAAADLALSKPGAATVLQAINSGLPLLAFDPLPGNERRLCDWIETWQIGFWVRRPQDLAPTVARLLANREELLGLRTKALARAQPHAGRLAAAAILSLWGTHA